MSEESLAKGLLRMHIRKSFLELSKSNEIRDITVTMLSAVADCSRATFYNYYENIDHLLFDCIYEAMCFKNLPQSSDEVEESLEGELRACVLFAQQYPRVVEYFLGRVPLSSLYFVSWHKNLQNYIDHCALLLNGESEVQIDRALQVSYVHFCCGGIERTLFDYVRKGCVRSVDNCVRVAKMVTMRLIRH